MTPWETGDVITAERLNGMMGIVVEFEFVNDGQYDKYFKSTTAIGESVLTAFKSATPIMFHFPDEQSMDFSEAWDVPIGYYKGQTNNYMFNSPIVTTSSNITEVSIDENGYIKAIFYID